MIAGTSEREFHAPVAGGEIVGWAYQETLGEAAVVLGNRQPLAVDATDNSITNRRHAVAGVVA